MKGPSRLKAWHKTVIAIALLLATIVLPLYAAKVWRKHDYTDFDVYYLAASRAKQGLWDQVYNLGDGASPFRYAPPLLPLFRPFAELSHAQAKMAWYFLQFAWFGLGFWFLSRAVGLTRLGRGRGIARGQAARPGLRGVITAGAFLFVLRFCLDCFTIGQVSSLLFLGYCAGLWAWMSRKPGAAGSWLLLPSVFKIGPGFLFSLLASSPKRRERERALAFPLLWFLAAVGALRLWLGSGDRFWALWRGWVEIVANDSVYYDASHYGSQSVKSAILRAVNSGWLTANSAQALYLALIVAGCLAILAFWLTRRARTPLGRGAFYALGIFPYLWFMPETFKYSLTTLAIPAALLLAQPRKDRFTWLALGFGALTLSLAGLDILGPKLFFGLQRASIPLVATLLLGIATWRMARAHSRPAWLAWDDESRASAPWAVLPRTIPSLDVSLLVPLPMQSVSALRASWIRGLVRGAHAELGSSGRSFEILLIPFGNRAGRLHPAWAEAERLTRELDGVRCLEASLPERGAALLDGFLASQGRSILSMNAEQPCEPSFYSQALRELESGRADIVRANRRHPESRFRIPVRTLHLVHGRHRLGLRFNGFVRTLLPISTTDTHSGSWAMRREAAIPIFALQRSPGFLFDLEAWVISSAHGHKQADLPVSLALSDEKSSLRVGRETWAIARGLPALWRRYRSGYYTPMRAELKGVTADDWGITPGVNQGILELARMGIVRRVSLMAYGAHLREGLAELKQVPALSLGLHFDLTFAKTSPASVLLQWLRPGAARGELAEQARAELRKQLGILREAGVTPTHLDGHHHIHLVPGLLEALAPVIREAGIRIVRLPHDPALLWRKPALWLLTRGARRTFERLGFESLPCFYPQTRHFFDQGKLRSELGRKSRSEVIVHPASVDDLPLFRIPDPYTSGRVTEYRALRMLAYDFAEPSPPGASPGALT